MKRDEEEKEHGVISFAVYKYYFKSIGMILCTLTFLFLALMQGKHYYYYNFLKIVY